ncbi:hypothetical protein [Longimicrobium sp.]|uniref:hypothetical protein n=1 Tax=Longimicrobium sp. TaxID=2029185 RepID=UPI002BD5802E|nr:hypothetical protein [Longimicrobium sp.]HSU15434.1 hypothetical protein [Longimicrobium sp.]
MTAHSLRRRATLLALVLLSACATGGQNGTTPARPRTRTTVHVQNTAFAAYTIYVVTGTDRRRLGVVNPASSADFLIPQGIVIGTTSLRILADPIGSDNVGSTFNIPVTEGDVVTVTIT